MTAAGSIRRVRGREAFRRLSSDGQRIRRRVLWCAWCPDPSSTTPSVAFALSRALGPAVTRNRLRRRLRAVCRELAASGEIPAGTLLIGANVGATELTYDQLMTEVRALSRAMTPAALVPPMPLPRSDASSA